MIDTASKPRQTALITGGSSGVGASVATMFAQRDVAVAVAYQNSQKAATDIVEGIHKMGVDAVAVQVDLADESAAAAMVETANDRLGGLGYLVNCAAVTDFIPFSDLNKVTTQLWEETFRVNVLGAWNVTRKFIQLGSATEPRSVVNLGSVAALTGSGSCIPYAVSKAALLNLTVCLARATAPHVRVNYVAPGFIDTPWYERFGFGSAYEIGTLRQSAAQTAALGRVNTADDIAAVVLWLAMDAIAMTGEVIRVDNGAHVGEAEL